MKSAASGGQEIAMVAPLQGLAEATSSRGRAIVAQGAGQKQQVKDRVHRARAI